MEGGSAAAAKGVLRDLHPLGDSPCRSLADSGACVPKILPTAELEDFLTGLIIAMPLAQSLARDTGGNAAISGCTSYTQGARCCRLASAFWFPCKLGIRRFSAAAMHAGPCKQQHTN